MYFGGKLKVIILNTVSRQGGSNNHSGKRHYIKERSWSLLTWILKKTPSTFLRVPSASNQLIIRRKKSPRHWGDGG